MIRSLTLLVVVVNACGGAPSPPTAAPQAPGAPEAPEETPTIVIPTTIDPTGTADVTNALNEFLAGVPDGSVIEAPTGALYKAEGVIRLINKRDITIEGNGATIFAETNGIDFPPPDDLKHLWPRKRGHVRLDGGSNITIRNLRVVGANPHAGVGDLAYLSALEAQHAFEIAGTAGVELDSVYASDVYGDFIYITSGSAGIGWADNIHVHDSRFERNGRQGLAITGGQNIVIENNIFNEVRRSNIDLEPPTEGGGAINVTIRRNTFGSRRLKFIASLGNGPNIRNIIVEDNVLSEPMNIRVGIEDARRGPFFIRNNTSTGGHGSDTPTMEFLNVDGVEVVGNYQALSVNRARTLVGVRNCTAVDVHDNEFPGGIYEVVTSW